MLTYQVHHRVCRCEPGQKIIFPAQCELCFHFQPGQPFFTDAGGGHTAVLGPIRLHFDANTGRRSITNQQPLSPLDVTIKEPTRTLRLEGTTLTISERFESVELMMEVITAVFFELPILLSIPFADPPYIQRVDGKVGATNFAWEVGGNWQGEFRPTTQQLQEDKVAQAWQRMAILAEPRRRRLIAGLHYFYVACRLARAGCVAGEFIAEVVLNLTKSLEAIFPPTGAGRSRDAVRTGLRSLGYSDDQIETEFVPAIAMRNAIDVGHVELGLFTMDQLVTIHEYTQRAEAAFRGLFDRLLTRIESGEFDIAGYDLGPPGETAIKVIERMKKSRPRGDG